MLSLGPALAAISRPPLRTALIGMLALACGVLLAIYDDLATNRRGMIALGAIARGDRGWCHRQRGAPGGGNANSRTSRRSRTPRSRSCCARCPAGIPPVDIAVRYVSAAASARIGGDLYEAISAAGRVRLIVGDVLGKGLPAARPPRWSWEPCTSRRTTR